MTRSVLWFRRDLRIGDHPALLTAGQDADEVVGLVVLDPALLAGGGRRVDHYLACVAGLRDRVGDGLLVRTGDPRRVVPAVAREVEAGSVHVTRESTPYGRRRDAAVRDALGGVGFVETGTPYAIGPGRVRTGTGRGYRVFTPFLRAWRDHGWPAPADTFGFDRWAHAGDPGTIPDHGDPAEPGGPADEQAALDAWHAFVDEHLDGYAEGREVPAADCTSRMSIPLKYGLIHPRTLLADLAACGGPGADKFIAELAWREFYADVLWHHPASAWRDLTQALATLDYAAVDEPGVADRVAAWRRGRTGYPIVDAGMRQLSAQGWMHNRVRMITASFLVKDLHVWWPVGARHFLDQLLDGDLASNNHGWQWVAGTGTDAAPYFRVFNPTRQGLRFDPEGAYVRRWVPELRHLSGGCVHEPWRHDRGYAGGYPPRIVDHATERGIALGRYHAARRA